MDLQVFEQKLRRTLIIGQNAAHFGGGDKHAVRFFLRIEIADGVAIEQLQFGMGAANQPGEAAAAQLAPDRAADQPAVARDINARI